MKKNMKLSIFLCILTFLLILIGVVACSTDPNSADDGFPTPPVTDDSFTSSDSSPSDDPSTAPSVEPSVEPPVASPSPPVVNLVPYDGVVEHIFFHEVIAWPELAFDGSPTQKGYDDNMVTVYEYNKILESLYKNGFILVDLNDVWSEYTDEAGVQRMRKNTLMLPEGKKPIVISYDDISFYDYMRGDGFMEKLIIGEDGDIWATGIDPRGNPVLSQDLTVVTILDKFVREHPGFSLNGVKGCIALTGYEGILGYRTHSDKANDTQEFRLNRMQEVARVRPVVQRLKETGWYFATHSYGHIWLDRRSLDGVKTDALRWLDEVGSLIGDTKIFIYPFGSRLDGGDVNKTGPAFKFYHELGFRIFASVGYEPYTKIKPDISAVILDRMNSDGITLRKSRERFLRFYDAEEVLDPMRP